MTLTLETLTVRLPAPALHRLRRIAEIAQRSVEDVLADTLEAGLPPLLEEVPADFQADLTELEVLPSAVLRQLLLAELDAKQVACYDTLLDRNAAGTLNESDQQALDELRRQADLIMYRKAYAALILKWRGEIVPTLAELEATP